MITSLINSAQLICHKAGDADYLAAGSVFDCERERDILKAMWSILHSVHFNSRKGTIIQRYFLLFV